MCFLVSPSVDEDQCCVGSELKPFGSRTLEIHHTYIFPALSMKCDGYIAAWEFYVKGWGQFYASVWREEGIGHYSLVGKNLVNSTKLGRQVLFFIFPVLVWLTQLFLKPAVNRNALHQNLTLFDPFLGQIQEIPQAEQIRVEKGDVIGIFFSKHRHNQQRNGLVAMEDQLTEVGIFFNHNPFPCWQSEPRWFWLEELYIWSQTV